MEVKFCVLVDRKICDDCGQCQICDLDPNKICDNCMKCVQSGAAYNAIEIDEIFETENAPGYDENELGQIWRESDH